MTTNSQVLDAFPKRALKPANEPGHARKRLLGLLIVLLLALPSAYMFFKVAREDALRTDLRATGVEAEVLNSEGSCTSRRQITGDEPLGCNLTITYRTRPEHGGEERTADVRLAGSAPRVFAPPAIYDPADPSRVMLKPEVERDAELDEFVLALVLLLLPAVGLLLWFATGKGRLAKAARDPNPVLVPIERVVRQERWSEYWVRLPGSAAAVRTMLLSTQRPFLARPPEDGSADEPWALALLDPKGRPLILDEDLALLSFTADEREALRTAAYA